MPEFEKIHADAKAEAVRKLKGHAAVAALVPDLIFDLDTPEGKADFDRHLRCMGIQEGKRYNPPGGNGRLLVQRDIKVTCKAEDREVLRVMLNSMNRALNGAVATTGFCQSVHTHSGDGDEGEIEGKKWYSRRDVYGLHCRTPEQESAVLAMPPPPKPVLTRQAVKPKTQKPDPTKEPVAA